MRLQAGDHGNSGPVTKQKNRKSVDQLEQELLEATRAGAALRTSLEQALKRLKDQQDRLNALGAGREETMRALNEVRAELARVCAERDQLQKRLTRIDGMQTETIALDEDGVEEQAIHATLPSLDDLMASLSSMDEVQQEHRSSGFGWQGAAETEPPAEMVAPDLIFTNDDEEEEAAPVRANRVLIYLDAHPPIKYPLFKTLVTIGRSAAADIQIDDDYISRLHARLISDEHGVIVEDADSKNGIKVNSKAVKRESLKHGDVLEVGKLRFTFIDIDGAA